MSQSSKPQNHNSNKPSFLVYLHSFRGFAMLNIVAIHSIAFAIYTCNKGVFDTKNPIHIANEILFHNSTIYFAVISGILFTSVLKFKGYRKFYVNKLKYVILPYIFFTLIFSLYYSKHDVLFVFYDNASIYLNKVLTHFIYGKAQFTFWYIPILVFLYLITPLLNYILTLKGWGKILPWLIILSSILISRVELIELNKSDELSLATMIYYTGAYMAGMSFGNNPELWLNGIKKYSKIILATAIFSTILLVYMEIVGVKNIGYWSAKAGFYYIQKMCLTGLFILLFKTIKGKHPKWINTVAKHAFTIYFLHAFFIYVGYKLLVPLINITPLTPLYTILIAVLFILISTSLSIFIAKLFNKYLGKYSKMFVGS